MGERGERGERDRMSLRQHERRCLRRLRQQQQGFLAQRTKIEGGRDSSRCWNDFVRGGRR